MIKLDKVIRCCLKKQNKTNCGRSLNSKCCLIKTLSNEEFMNAMFLTIVACSLVFLNSITFIQVIHRYLLLVF